MRTWMLAMGLALANVMLVEAALAQTPPGRRDVGPESYATKSDARKTTAVRARKSAPAAGDEMVKAAQQALKDKGHDPGSVDGRMGRKTQQALRDFQAAHGIEPTGQLDLTTLVSLGVEPARTSRAGDATGGSASPATTDSGESAASPDAPAVLSGDAKK